MPGAHPARGRKVTARAPGHDNMLARAMGPVARELLGEPNPRLSSKTELRFGSHGSMAIDLIKGTWFDHEAGEGGGTLDLLRLRRGLINGAGMAWLKERGHIEPQPNRPSSRARSHSGREIVMTYP